MAAPEFTLFVKPYLEGWDNGEEGNTPITAEILNDNYDAFLLALNDWATSVGLILDSAVTDPNYVHTDNNYTSTEKNKLSGIEANANNYVLPTASAVVLGGVKVDGITIVADNNGVITAIGGGSDVEGNPIPFTPNGVTYTVATQILGNNPVAMLYEYVNGVQESTDSEFLTAGTDVYFGNIKLTYDGTKVTVISERDSINYNGNVALTDDIILESVLTSELQRYENIEEGSGAGFPTAVLKTLRINDDIFSIPEGGMIPAPTGVTYDFEYSTDNSGTITATQYTDGVQTDQGSISYASISVGGPNPVDVGDIRLQFAMDVFYIYSKDSSNTLVYNDNEYEFDDTIFEINRMSGEATSGVIVETELIKLENLEDLLDVDITTPSSGQVLGYDPVSHKWKNINQSGGTTVEGNPSGTATAVLTKIQIGNDIYSIPGGSGGGSTVSYSQILATGTKIGTITIDGVPTDIYAPTPPTKTSDLNNDSNFVSDANYVHTDNNYTSTEKNKLSGLVAVEANPSGSASTDLTKIAIGGTNYNIPSGGGGGTTVVANPSGSATDELNKLQVGNTIYSIPEVGGGDVVNVKRKDNDYTTLTSSATSIDILWSDVLTESNAYVFHCVKLYYITGDKWYLKAVSPCTCNGTDYDTGDLINSWVDIAQVNFDVTGVQSEGTTVIANPSGEATANLNKLQVGNDIYQIPSGGGNTLCAVEDVLYDTEVALEETTYTLDASINDYDFVRIVIGQNPENSNYIYSVDQLHDTTNNCVFYNQGGYGIVYANSDGDELTFDDFSGLGSNRTFRAAYGLKLTNSGGGSSGFTDYEGILTAGQTSLTITGLEIDNTKLFDYYTDILGVNPTSIVVTNGHVTLTFPVQQTDMSVIVSVRSKTHINKPFDIDLSDFVENKIWKYYDSANWSDATSDGSKITIAGGEDRSDWTTATWVCIDLTQYPVPNNLSKLKIHLPSIETLGYSGLCVVTDSDKFGPGSNGGSDTMIRKTRMEISSGIYVLGDPSLGINETDYTLEIPCTKNDLSRYLYIGAIDGVNPSDSNTYSNSLNGSFDVKIDGIWYE